MSRRIAEQTKEWIIEAFIDLLKTKSFEEIKTTEICKKALVSRNTFYRKFNSKNDIVEKIADNLIANYISQIQSKSPEKFQDLITIVFQFGKDNFEILKTLSDNNLLSIVLKKLNSLGPKLYQSVELPWHTFSSDDSIKIMMNFFIGGFWNILTDWISNPSKYSIDELAEKTTAALENVIMFIWFSLVHQPNLF